MLNQIILVGRLTRDVEVKVLENGSKVANVTLAINRSYKNDKGEYDADFIDVSLWNAMAENTEKYCNKGNLVGVKGHLNTNIKEGKDGKNVKSLNVVAEKISFLEHTRDKDTQER